MPTPTTTCCPTIDGTLLTYVSPTGYFYNRFTGNYELISTWTGGVVSDTYGKCVVIQGSGNAYGNTEDPIDCKCCPDDFIYIQYLDACVPSSGVWSNLDVVPTIPCITCVCTNPIEQDCPTCGSAGQHITYSWDFSRASCTTCTPQDINNPPGPIQAFLAVQLLDPVISTFVLRNKNFI